MVRGFETNCLPFNVSWPWISEYRCTMPPEKVVEKIVRANLEFSGWQIEIKSSNFRNNLCCNKMGNFTTIIMIAPLHSHKFLVSCDINLTQGWNHRNKGQMNRGKSAKNPVEFHIRNSTFLLVIMGHHRGLYNTFRGNRAAGMSFRFTRTPTNVHRNLPEL